MLTDQEITGKATEFVEKWRQYCNRPDNFFGPPEHGPFQKLVLDLEHTQVLAPTKKLCAYVLRDDVHGSPILLNNGTEIIFNSFTFAKAVMLELKRRQLYQNLVLLQQVI